MTSRSSNRSGHAHEGTGSRRSPRHGDPLVNHELIGTVRWLDHELSRIVLGVEETHAHAGPFLGRDVTVDVSEAALHETGLEDLTPGCRVRVKARMPEVHGAGVPELIGAHAVYALGEVSSSSRR
ncbi:MAG: hypothetical protein J7513_06460 [Solirubrobacteraceae bacterium]|nr:hypothetical protein [Solirubrobacteraceae bacterium]